MMHEDEAPRRPELPKYVRVVGTIWLVLLLAVIIGALLAPHMGRLIDFALHQTSHRQWTAIRLQPDVVYFDRSGPIHTLQSYYSALYRVSASDMEALTNGALQKQMRRQMQGREAAKEVAAYRSFARVIEEAEGRAVVEEKFHLFWRRGLRFVMQDVADGWRVVAVGQSP
ncbi:hypothetical protein [Candidatus Entotheonella palauensis]|nr:hypothetical protein [Candidatus Entotheonella palauensis]